MNQTLINNLKKLAVKEGYNPSNLSGVGVYKASESTPRVPLCYSQGIIIVVQGKKRVYFDQKTYEYNPDNYLVLTLPLPAECETIVEPGEEMLSLIVDLDVSVLSELVRVYDDFGQNSTADLVDQSKGLYISQTNEGLACVMARLSQCLQSPIETQALGKGLIRELYFHVLSGTQAAPLFALVSHNTQLSRIDRVLKHLHGNFSAQLDVDKLAQMANMSTSTFHRNFKMVTASSPIQYVKKIRLNRAKELLLDQGLKVKQAAANVGYESATQFSREFARYFGQSPSEYSRTA